MDLTSGVDLKALGALLRSQREELGLSQSTLARKAHIGRTTIWAVERGGSPTSGKAPRLAREQLERWVRVLRLDEATVHEVMVLAGYAALPGHLVAPVAPRTAGQPGATSFEDATFFFPGTEQDQDVEFQILVEELRQLLHTVPEARRADVIEQVRSFFSWQRYRLTAAQRG